MTHIRLFTKPGCPYCVDAKAWLEQNGCPFEALDITKDVKVLREWRELSGGVGVPVLTHGRDLVIGFSPERYNDFLTSCQRTTAVDANELEDQAGISGVRKGSSSSRG
jgi:glutaredoxin 3